MRVSAAGGDGLGGRPAALCLAARGHTAPNGDGLSRRLLEVKLGSFYHLWSVHDPHNIDGDGRGPSRSRM